MKRSIVLALGGLLAFAASAPAQGTEYPPPGRPGGSGQQAKPKGKTQTHTVARRGKAEFRSIQAAVDAAKKGDTIRVANGTYSEGVRIIGPKKGYIKLIGNAKNPAKVVLDGKRVKGLAGENGVQVNGADGVKVQGFTARDYRANGFFVRSVYGYVLEDLVASRTGVYGIYAFDSIGGTMRDSTGAWNNDAGFYIGQTPPQKKGKIVRSIVERVSSYGNVIGFSGTNMRYVTIRNSKFYNNGLGVVPSALASEKYPPEEDNTITNNDIFWNNFNYFAGAPFELRRGATAVPYPVGIGFLALGGRRTTVTRNSFFGNWLLAAGGISQFELAGEKKQELRDAAPLEKLEIRQNTMTAADGTDANGRDVAFDMSGTGNCASGNAGADTFVPSEGIPACPFDGANGKGPLAVTESELIDWALDPNHGEGYWIKTTHSAPRGFDGKPIVPLERYAAYAGSDKPKNARCVVSTVDGDKPVTTKPC